MKRFNYDDNDDSDEEYYPPDYLDDDDDDDDMIGGENYIYITGEAGNASVLKRELNQKLLFEVIRMLEKSWFWSFKSIESKNKKILETFMSLKSLLDIVDLEDQDEEMNNDADV